MKRKISFLTVLFMLVFACFCFAGCDKERGNGKLVCEILSTEETQIVITVSEMEGEWTLQDCMQQLAEGEQISYSVEGGMITQINGKANGGNSYWMIYISDTEFSNTAWGTITYNDAEYASAILGADALPVKAGHTYIFSYQSF